MTNRRSLIEMDGDEIQAFLDEERVAIASSLGPRGWPHSMPLWYVVRNERLFAWTFTKSQKIKHLQRDSRATVLVESGAEYSELRGVQFETEVILHDDIDLVIGFAERIALSFRMALAFHRGEDTSAVRPLAPEPAAA